MKNKLYDIVSYLELVFHQQEKQLKKINIPMIMLCADIALGDDYDMDKKVFRIGPKYFYQWFTTFFVEEIDEYSQYCSSGSTKLEKTTQRIEVMQNSLISYFELDDVDGTSEEEEDATPLLEQEDNSSNDECESTSIVDDILADMEEHVPPDEETNE